MPVPGYGAEASIYRSTGQYRAALAAGIAPPGGVAVPQQVPLPCWGLQGCALFRCECWVIGGTWYPPLLPWLPGCGYCIRRWPWP
jgi:hypothetical protein